MSHSLGYRQGMNEIVAVIVFHGLNEEETEDGLADWTCIEADSYWVFEKIMKLGLTDIYSTNDYFKHRSDSFAEIPTLDRSHEEEVSSSIRKCHYIFHRILSRVDPELFAHIHKHKYEPQLYLLRWLRCMLCREFQLNQIAEIWDVMLSNVDESTSLVEILNYFCTSLLCVNRSSCIFYLVLEKSGSALLQFLMKPFSLISMTELIEKAVFFVQSKPDKNLTFGVNEKEEPGILQKVLSLFTEKPVGHEKNQLSVSSEKSILAKVKKSQLEEALINVDEVINIVNQTIEK
jgi:hypothetical protein